MRVAQPRTVSGDAWRNGVRLRYRLLPQNNISVANNLAWRDDSQRLAVNYSVGKSRVVDARSGSLIAELPPHMSATTARSLVYVPGKDILVMGGGLLGQPVPSPIALTILDGSSGEVLRQIVGNIPLPPNIDFTSLNGRITPPVANAPRIARFDPDSGMLVVSPGGGIRGLQVYDPTDWRVRSWLFDAVHPGGFALRPGRPDVAVSGYERLSNHVRVFNRHTGTLLWQVLSPIPYTNNFWYSRDGELLVVGYGLDTGFPGAVLSSADGRLLVRLETDLGACVGLTFHPDNSIFIVGGYRYAAIYDTASLKVIGRFDADRGGLHGISFSPDGSLLCAGGGSVAVYEPR